MALPYRTIKLIKYLTWEFNRKSFISSDPVKFPHKYSNPRDIEISAFITSWVSFGKRSNILKVSDLLDKEMNGSPYKWIMSKGYESITTKYNQSDCLYRFLKYRDWYLICERLHEILEKYGTIERAIIRNPDKYYHFSIQKIFEGCNGIPRTKESASKRLNMFLRWMVRNDKLVDFGIYESLSTSKLIIPLDTNVHKQSIILHLTRRKTADLKCALEITESLKWFSPNDPVKHDFALFGYGVCKNKGIIKEILKKPLIMRRKGKHYYD